MDEVDRFIEEEEEDALLDDAPAVLETREGSDALLSAEPVDEATWVRPALPHVHPDEHTIGASSRS